MKKHLSFLTLSLIISVFSFAQTDADYATSLKKMFRASGTEESYQAAIKQMFTMFKEQSPNVKASVWDEYENEFLHTSINELVEMLVPVYKKYMSIDDLEAMIKFYETPVGQKYAKSTPLIMRESMEIGQKWGERIGEEIGHKLKEKGY